MNSTLTEKILAKHLVDGKMQIGEEIGIKVDHVLMQDTTGTMACLQFEALGMKNPVCERAVQYIDHNLLQISYENADDHKFLQSFAAKHGIFFSKAGNGICHQVNLERFSVPGKVLLGSDSHTPTAGGAGMLGIGVGGLDVAVAMGGGAYYFEMPKIVGVKLLGKLKPWVSAKDIILSLLQKLTVKGGIGSVFEYYGEGVKTLSVPERATITNMGAELGVTSSIFPSDEITKQFFNLQQRSFEWKPLERDKDAYYDEEIVLDLTEIVPLIACPSSPDNVRKVSEVEGTIVDQVIIGSCTNSSYRDLMIVSEILEKKRVHPNVDFHINPGSRQVLQNIIHNGGFKTLVDAGARIFENGCDGCVGIGSAPPTNSVSLRSFNRNFSGRSGTKNDQVYLASPEVCVTAAIIGKIVNPQTFGDCPEIDWPKTFLIDDSMIVKPPVKTDNVQVIRGPNIWSVPLQKPLESNINGEVVLKVGNNITTDSIMPAGAKVMALRSNIPAISEYVFKPLDANFVSRVKKKNGGFIVAGENYGQGSSREHAALAPMYLGVKAVLAKSFARIHKANLINVGILPLEFTNPDDYDCILLESRLCIKDIREKVKGNNRFLNVEVGSETVSTTLNLSRRMRDILVEGGLLNYTKRRFHL
ncbi:MAG: aconitate hydratase [Candidatus Bathyarchaeota archaeon]|nr:MAG: aconitate hydratase [Candidatus Bathyarchaeota archaeon]